MLVSSVETNQPLRRGCLASRKVRFGDHGRYAIAAVHTRFGAVQWFVWDAETPDPKTGLADVIRQADTQEDALNGLL